MDQQLKNQFDKLVREWKHDCMFHSSPTVVRKHPNAAQLVKMGNEIIPEIIIDLKQSGWFGWFDILRDITECSIIPRHHAGIMNLMVDDWMIWYEFIYMQNKVFTQNEANI